MNEYEVRWGKRAEVQLAALWLRAVNKEAIARYVHQFEVILARDPHEQGESRELNTRLAFYRPLAFRFHIDEPKKVVTVLAMKWVGL